jgi:hypothetical protein
MPAPFDDDNDAEPSGDAAGADEACSSPYHQRRTRSIGLIMGWTSPLGPR